MYGIKVIRINGFDVFLVRIKFSKNIPLAKMLAEKIGVPYTLTKNKKDKFVLYVNQVTMEAQDHYKLLEKVTKLSYRYKLELLNIQYNVCPEPQYTEAFRNEATEY